MQRFYKLFSGLVVVTFASSLLAEDSAFPTVDCVITPSEVVEISAAVPGVVEQLYVDRSDPVTQGQLLVELKADVEKASVKLAEARSEMRAELSAEQVNLKYDRIQSSRVSQLGEKKLASSQNLDEASRIKKVTYWRLKQAEESVKLRELELARAQAQLEEKRIYSTIDGVVAERYKNEGEYVEDQPIFKLVQLNPLHIESVFPMEYYSRVGKGMTATMYPEVDQKTGYPVTVELIDSLGDAASGTFGVRLILDNTDYQLPAGLKCFLQVDENQTAEPLEESSTTSLSASDEILKSATTDTLNGNAEPANVDQAIPPQEKVVVNKAATPPSVTAQTTSANTPLPVPNIVERNVKLGPYSSKDQVEKVMSLLDKRAAEYTLETTSSSVPLGYMVISSADYKQKGSVLLSQFSEAGVKDMGRLPRNSYGGRISFGAYKGPVQAEARKTSLAKLMIKAEVITRYKQTDEYWLRVKQIPQSLFEHLNLSSQQ